MNKEKIILGNGTELEYDRIGFRGGALVIGFVGGSAADLESTFRSGGQTNLETIKQASADGSIQATHKLYDILSQIVVNIDAAENGEEKKNLVEVVLQQEEEWQAEIRHIREEMAAGGGSSEAVEALDTRVANVEADVQSISKAIMNQEVAE